MTTQVHVTRRERRGWHLYVLENERLTVEVLAERGADDHVDRRSRKRH